MSSIHPIVSSGKDNDSGVHDNTPVHGGVIHRGHQWEERKDIHRD